MDFPSCTSKSSGDTSCQHLDQPIPEQVQIAADGATLWVHAEDGSTVGRFSKRFGMDVHTTVTAQINGQAQCLKCTHEPGTQADWERFVDLMWTHHAISIPIQLMAFDPAK
jgi:hypothetical protein